MIVVDTSALVEIFLREMDSDAIMECLASRRSVCGLDAESVELARGAATTYGRGTGHRAGLNFGDCLVYAVAKHRDLPLLYVGDDFSHTDIASAL